MTDRVQWPKCEYGCFHAPGKYCECECHASSNRVPVCTCTPSRAGARWYRHHAGCPEGEARAHATPNRVWAAWSNCEDYNPGLIGLYATEPKAQQGIKDYRDTYSWLPDHYFKVEELEIG